MRDCKREAARPISLGAFVTITLAVFKFGLWLGTGAGLLMALSACAGSQWPPLAREALPTTADYPDADAVVLEESQTLAFESTPDGPRAVWTERRRVAVLTADGASASNLMGFYSKSFQSVLDVRGRVVHPDGSVDEISRKEVGDHPSVGNTILFQDTRRLAHEFTAVPAGAVVEWEVVTEDREPTWRQFRQLFGGRQPTQKTRFEVVVPDGWAIDYQGTQRWSPIAFEPQVVAHDTGGQRYIWEKRDLSPVKREPSAPGLIDVVPVISVRLRQWKTDDKVVKGFESHEDFARWMHGVQARTDTRSPALEATVKTLVAEAGPDPRAQAAAMYRWVQEKIRYVAIEVGIGGWRPHDAVTVFKHRYGDCKDKANLLRTMLRIAGIDSYLTSIFSHDGVPRPFGLPAVGNSNHAILAIELADGLQLADPTSRAVPFGQLPINIQGADALVIDNKRPRIVRTAWSSPADNVKRLNISLVPDKAGLGARGQAELAVAGTFDWSLRATLVRSAVGRHDKIFETWLWMDDVDVDQVKFDVASSERLTATGDIVVPRIGSAAGDRIIYRVGDFLRTPGGDFQRSPREHPVVFESPVVRETSVRLALTGRMTPKVPDPIVLDTSFGAYRQSWRIDDGQLLMESRFERKAQMVSAADYSQLVDFREAVVAARNQPIVLVSNKKEVR